MATKSATKKLTKEALISRYMDHVLEHDAFPKSVYKFCKQHDIPETEFYALFGSFEALRKGVWNEFFTNTVALMEKNKAYTDFSNKDKMLTFFFTFFELLTLNRSYVLFCLQDNEKLWGKLEELKGLRTHIKGFATDLIEDANANKNLRLTKQSPKLFSEGAWVQLLFLLKFWLDDSSPGFEKTDMAIEKSVTTIFDVFDNTPLESLVDFGKFLFQERRA
ncbi:MAG: TetR family transcriptional regulator C-terminal domain-containing protein [Bacteroidota bacterium]